MVIVVLNFLNSKSSQLNYSLNILQKISNLHKHLDYPSRRGKGSKKRPRVGIIYIGIRFINIFYWSRLRGLYIYICYPWEFIWHVRDIDRSIVGYLDTRDQWSTRGLKPLYSLYLITSFHPVSLSSLGCCRVRLHIPPLSSSSFLKSDIATYSQPASASRSATGFLSGEQPASKHTYSTPSGNKPGTHIYGQISRI